MKRTLLLNHCHHAISVSVLLVAWLLLTRYPQALAAPTGPTASNAVAVFPFVNRGTEQDWLGQTLTDMLIAALSRIPSIRVVERDRLDALEREWHLSQLQQAEAVGKLAQLEFVGRVIISTFCLKGENLEIQCALVDTTTGNPVSIAKSTGPLEKASSLLEQAARELLRRIGANVSEKELSQLKLVPTYDFSALQWQAKGREHFAEGAYTDALEAFRRAVQRDSGFTQALEALAQVYDMLGEVDHGILAYQRAMEAVNEPVAAMRVSSATRLLAERIPNVQRRNHIKKTTELKEMEVLKHTLEEHPLARLDREAMWQKYRKYWKPTEEALILSATPTDFTAPFQARPYIDKAALLGVYHQVLHEEIAFLQWSHRYIELLEGRGMTQASYHWNDQTLHLERFALLSVDEEVLARHAFRWQSAQDSSGPAPEWTVVIDPKNPTWSFPEEASAREKFLYSDGYRIAFVAPQGSHILKGTFELVLDEKPEHSIPVWGPMHVLRWDHTYPESWCNYYMEEKKALLTQAQHEVLTSVPKEQQADRLSELWSRYVRETWTSLSHTYLTPAGTTGMRVTLPLYLKRPSERSPKDLLPIHYKFHFALTSSASESLLPPVIRDMLDSKPSANYRWAFAADPPDMQLSLNGRSIEKQSSGNRFEGVSVDPETLMHFELRSPDGRKKTFTARSACSITYTLSTRNGWKPLPEPVLKAEDGCLVIDERGVAWLMASRLNPQSNQTDLYLQKSEDLVTWSQPAPFPFNTTYDEKSPRLVESPSGTLRLFWSVPRPTPVTGGNTWTSSSIDGLRWSDPVLLRGEVPVGSKRLYGISGGIVWFDTRNKFLSCSADGEHWRSESCRLALEGSEQPKASLLATAQTDEGTLLSVWSVKDAAADPTKAGVRIVEAESMDGVRWEVTSSLPTVKSTNLSALGYWHTRAGWVLMLRPPTWSSNAFNDGFYWLLLPARGEARVLPQFCCPDPPAQWLEKGEDIYAVWPPYVWTCPLRELADQPVADLPLFDKENLASGENSTFPVGQITVR